MLSQGIRFKNFKFRNKDIRFKNRLISILSEKNEIINSLKKSNKHLKLFQNLLLNLEKEKYNKIS